MALAANPGNTMQALADNTGISKASLHRIYSTKEKLQATFVERMRDVFAEIRRTIREPHENYMEALGGTDHDPLPQQHLCPLDRAEREMEKTILWALLGGIKR